MLKDWTLFEKAWLGISVAVITLLGFLWEDTLLGMISSISGIICVVLVAKGKISNYLFGIIQCSTYGYISYTYGLYGESMLNLLFFLPAQFIGFYLWWKNRKNTDQINGEEVYAKRLNRKQWLYVLVFVIVTYICYSAYLVKIGANLAGLDGLAVVLSVVAQLLLALRFAEQWLMWIIINIITISLWIVILIQSGGNDWTVLAMWVAFLINSIYGYINWLRISKADGNDPE
ncbi:MAG: nicotinamide riboside transporter PnuC [Lysinibacillus sp.]